MYKRYLLFSIGFSFILFFSGCSTRLVDFTIISTKNVDLAGTGYEREKSRSVGQDEISIIIFVPMGTASIKEAIDRTIESVPGGVAILDGVVTSSWWYIPYIYGKSKYVVEGTVLVDPNLASENSIDRYIVASLDKNGDLINQESVSSEKFLDLKKKLIY
tara:strand:- start:1 stop:480 length:480 start_codon:yes stop_codon:yes gene_type:complete